MIHKEVTDILPYITKCYETEVHLYPDFGYGGIQDPAHMAKLEAASMKSPTSKYFVVYKDDTFVGYFCTYKVTDLDALGSFFIVPECRNLKLDFFNLIGNLLNNKYLISLKPNNSRAIKFLEKIGAQKYYNLADNVYYKLGDF